jgi:amidohydrolase
MRLSLTLLSFIGFACTSAVHAQAITPTASYEPLVKEVMPKVINWRRHFHEHPELSNQEVKTANTVAAHLKSLGLEVKTGIARTGVTGILKGGKPGPVMVLRADMDGLPVTERSGLPFASKVTAEYEGQQVGVMHACGHDAHMAILMGAAEVLSKIKKDIAGTVVFLFQPAEEGTLDGEGGAQLMIKEGVLDSPKADVVFGLHIFSNVETGTIAYKKGAFMASSDWFSIKVKGKGSHGASPWLGIDPIIVSAQILEGLQHIVSRQEDITKAPAIITVGSIKGGVRNNIIPEECEMLGTIRTLDNATQQDIHKRIKQTAEHIAASAGATAEVSITTQTMVTFNPPDLVEQTLPSLQAAAGKNNVHETTWKTVAEDFSFYGTKALAFFFFLGGMPKGMTPETAPGHHTADFSIDESGFDVGVKAFCQLVLDYGKAAPAKKK